MTHGGLQDPKLILRQKLKNLKLEIMSKKRMLIDTKAKYRFCKMISTEENFHAKFELSPEMSLFALAEKEMMRSEHGDRAMTTTDMMIELSAM